MLITLKCLRFLLCWLFWRPQVLVIGSSYERSNHWWASQGFELLFRLLRLLGDSSLNEICRILHRGNRFGTILANADVEFLFQGHHYLHLQTQHGFTINIVVFFHKTICTNEHIINQCKIFESMLNTTWSSESAPKSWNLEWGLTESIEVASWLATISTTLFRVSGVLASRVLGVVACGDSMINIKNSMSKVW